jgi:predicted aconitase with swiveling domain
MNGPMTLRGRVLSPGEASGAALVLEEPLSLWGGMDPATGRVIDAHHPQHGATVTGRVLVMASARGSSSSSSILAEAVRAGTAPAAILLGDPDLILPIGAAVAAELYGRRVPILVVTPQDMARIADGAAVTIGGDGVVGVESGGRRR